MQPQNPVAAGSKVKVVRDQDQGGAQFAIELEQQFADRFRSVVVQIAGGLVGQQQPRAVNQRAGDGDTLLLATRKLTGIVMQTVLQPHAREQRTGSRVSITMAGDLQRECRILQRAEAGKEMEGLKDDPDAVAA